MIKDIKEKIENSHYYKFTGVAPEGFTLVPDEVLEQLHDFDTWKEWKNNPDILHDMIKQHCVKNFTN